MIKKIKATMDYQAEEKKRLLETIERLKANKIEYRDSIEVLRELRGYRGQRASFS
jgi:hypothetical protein